MVTRKSSQLASAIDKLKLAIKELEKLQDEFNSLLSDRQALNELKPLISKVKKLYQDEPASSPELPEKKSEPEKKIEPEKKSEPERKKEIDDTKKDTLSTKPS